MVQLLNEGTTSFRFNNSHGSIQLFTHYASIFEQLRTDGYQFNVMVDTRGPEIRIGQLPKPKLLEAGLRYTFAAISECRINEIPINNDCLCNYLSEGDILYINDGKLRLAVVEIQKNRFIAVVKVGGTLYSNKGINVPAKKIPQAILTEEDRRLLEYLKRSKLVVDQLAISFVQNIKELQEIREYLAGSSLAAVKIIAKIECKQAVLASEEILREADGVMIARGDLSIEVGYGEVPYIQKRLLKKAAEWNKYSIVATELLATMEYSPFPTRAEISDVANALIDGTDALMLSAETAVGQYPLAAVSVLKSSIAAYWSNQKEC